MVTGASAGAAAAIADAPPARLMMSRIRASRMSNSILEINSTCKPLEFRTEKFSSRYGRDMGKVSKKPVWARRFRQEMDRRSWSTGDLAAAMGHPKDEALIGKLHKYLQGRVENPRGPLMGEIAAAFDMSETELRLGDGRRRQESDQIDQPSEAPALIREYDLRAGMGGGGFPDRAIVLHGNISDPVKPDRWQFPQGFIRQDLRAPQDRLLIV